MEKQKETQVQFEGVVEGTQVQTDKFRKLLERLIKLNNGVLSIKE